MSVELLQRAAKTLREHADSATPGPWEHVDYASPHGQPMTKDGLPATFMGCGSVITLGKGVAGGDIAAPNGDLYPRSGYSPSDDMALVALMHPLVALALAELLSEVGDSLEQDGGVVQDSTTAAAISVARQVLREAVADV